ncbi:MAG TPA: CotH kinase family protein [Kofleriaceae bacterium]|nr:CotH kinase family protein [Kofleriaceae bacterium]
MRASGAVLWVALAACSGSVGGAGGDGGPEQDGDGAPAGDPDADPGPPVLCEVVLDCGGAEIPDEPKIACDIEIGDGKGAVVHAGRIGIERRGRSSIAFPKAQYSVELRTDADAEQPVALFGMGKESDWILNGMYIDRALFRNKLFFDLFQRMGGAERYAPETRFCELTLDGDDRGIYLLTEKVKRDDDRIALAETGPDGQSFILKQDEEEQGFHPVGVAYGGWQLVYPNAAVATDDQIAGISAWLDGWEAAVGGTGDLFDLMDLENAVDFVLLQEFARGNDAYFLSMHVWKDVGGVLFFTPWDLDLSLGQPLYGDSTLTTGWINYRPQLVQAMADDARFAERLVERWAELRAGDFAAAALEARIQSYLAVTGDRIDENFTRWPIEDIHFFDPDQLPPRSSHAEEMESVRSFIAGRLDWMDAHIDEYAAGN